MSSFHEPLTKNNDLGSQPDLQSATPVTENKIEPSSEHRPVLKKETDAIASFAAAAQNAQPHYTEEQLKAFTILPSGTEGLELSQFIDEFKQLIEEQRHDA